MVDTVHEGYLTWPEFSQTGSTVQTGIRQNVWRLCTTVYTFVLIASLKPVFSKVRKEELDDDHENDIGREFDEARRAKLKYK